MSRVAAVIAVIVGVRAGICRITAADVDVLGLRGDPGEHRHGVRSVGLGGPRDGVAEPVGLLDQRESVLGAAAVSECGVPVAPRNHNGLRTCGTALSRSGEPVALPRGSAQCGTKRVEGQSPRARHHDVGCGDRCRRSSRPAGDLPRCRRHARRHCRVLRLRRDRRTARATARRRRPARRSGDRDQSRHHPHRRGPGRRLLARGAAASAGPSRCASWAPTTSTSGTCTTSTTRCRSTRRWPHSTPRSVRARCATPGSPTTAAGASVGCELAACRSGSHADRGQPDAVLAARPRHRARGRPGVRRAGGRPVPVSPLGGGVLTGKYRGGVPPTLGRPGPTGHCR